MSHIIINKNKMTDNNITVTTLIIYIVSALSGCLGGVATASIYSLRGRPITAILIISYGILGIVLGVSSAAYISIFSDIDFSIDQIIMLSIITGLCGTATIAGTNLSFKWILRQMGLEIELKVSQCDKKNKNE